MQRKICLMFLAYEQHIDLSFLNNSNVVVETFLKGQPSSNGNQAVRKNNITYIRFAGEIPDEYDLRIDALIEAIGGEDVVRKLVLDYRASSSAIIFDIPCKTSDWNEEGYISYKIMQKISDLKLDIGFSYF